MKENDEMSECQCRVVTTVTSGGTDTRAAASAGAR